MKKIIICGSISAADEIIEIMKKLELMGFEVEVPEGVKRMEIRDKPGDSEGERASIKIKYDLIRSYFEKMKNYDAVLVVNPEKKDIHGYIGGNTLIEMAFAHILNKPLYVLYQIPDMQYTSEILAMKPIVLNGNLEILK
ncbi:MAG: hypothetical protein PHH21_02425 [Candidatus Pacebacteria bacterium]|nr:hypothetical protein [Candidatus Paceibacterota bacterium]